MIKLKINDKIIEADNNQTILKIAKNNNINIPTLCYLKDINNNASCRMCLVEILPTHRLVTACTTIATDGMEILTESNAIISARKQNLELILSNHHKDCNNCLKDNNCKLQDLFNKYNIEDNMYNNCSTNQQIDESTSYLIRDNSKCILCGRCTEVCKNIQGIAIIGKNNRGIKAHIGTAFETPINNTACVACGQCTLVCPTGALTEKDDTKTVLDAISNKDLHVIVATAPAVRVALGEEFGLPIGTNVKGKMVNALKTIGFDKVFDINFAADLTIIEEVNELIERIKNKGTFPMFTSCSPGWINYIEHYHPDMINNLSTCKSPQQMFGAIIKSYYAKKNNLDPKKIFVVTIMPCVAKKFERTRIEHNNDIDAVLTTRELARIIKNKKINFNNLNDEEFDNPLGIGACTIFGNSGGVMESALRTLCETLTNKELDNINFTEVRGLQGIKEANYKINNMEVKVAIVSGLSNAKTILNKIKNKECDYHFVEFMTCPGGCINGGGQPINHDIERDELLKKRMEGLLQDDRNLPIHKAHENPIILTIYDEFLGNPGSKEAKHILHTQYTKKDKY